MSTRKPAPTPPSNKENSSLLANVASSPTVNAGDLCPDKEDTTLCPVEDEFDDADVLEALVEAEKEKSSSKA